MSEKKWSQHISETHFNLYFVHNADKNSTFNIFWMLASLMVTSHLIFHLLIQRPEEIF